EGAVKTIIEGVELTEKEMLRSLESHGVKKLNPVGERFDPNFHEAMFEVPDPSVPSGTVTKVVEAGYSIGSRALRPAKVGVASGGGESRPTPTPAEGSRAGREEMPDQRRKERRRAPPPPAVSQRFRRSIMGD